MSQENLDDLSDTNLSKHIDIKLPQQVQHHHFHSSQQSHSQHIGAHHEHTVHNDPVLEKQVKGEGSPSEEIVEPIPEADPVSENDPSNSQSNF